MTRPVDVVDIDLLLVDGDNLLHTARGRRDDGGVSWLLPELARWRRDGMRVVVALDGHPAPGESSRGRAAGGVEYHYAGSRPADDLLIEILGAQPFSGRARSVVVSSDLVLADRTRRAGGLARSGAWLLSQLASGRTVGTQAARGGRIGRVRTGAESSVRADPDGGSRTWRPGRGATRKRGNPRRSSRRGHRG
jgi:hypothetical protein